MDEENLWGNIPEPQKITTPHNLLFQQGAILEKMTNSLLTSKIIIYSSNVDSFEAGFRIIAPTLGGYSVEILKIQYGLTIYPVTVYNVHGSPPFYNAKDEEGLKTVFKNIFTSEQVRQIISSLLNQIYSKE